MIILLIISIVSASFLNLGFSEAAKRKLDGTAVILSNYICVVAMSAIILFVLGWPDGTFNLKLLLHSPVIWETNSLYTYGILLGIINGLFYYLCFDVTQKGIEHSGPSLTTLASNLGIIVASGVTVRLWGEEMTVNLILGLVIACIAFCLLLEGKKTFSGMIPIVFLVGGLAEIAKKVYTIHSVDEHILMFNFLAFFVCLILSAAVLYKKKHCLHLKKEELILGDLIGVSNLIASYATIVVLTEIPASVVFPTLSGGNILLTTLFGAMFYGETLNRRKVIGILFAIASLVLMNLGK